MNIKLISILALVTIIATISPHQVNAQNDRYFEISKNLQIFAEVYKELNANYVDELDPNELMRIGIDAMVNSLDPYTTYISEAQIASYRLNDQETYKGIGARMEVIDDYVTVVEPYDGGPALEAGLKAGDQIRNVGRYATKGRSLEEVSAIVKGAPGTEAQLQIYRPSSGETLAITLTRGSVERQNVPHYDMVSPEVAYVSLTTFTQAAGANIAKGLKELQKDNPNMKGVILDLRHNGGGLLAEALHVTNIFVPKGLDLVTTKGKVKDRDRAFTTRNVPVDVEIPLVVLIDNKSASASEIVSGSIQDLDRGVIMGQRSYGKGLVQNTKDLNYNSRVKLTTSKYYILSRRCIQSVAYENGEPKDIPDDQRSVFKTKNGRKVLDGGGITPDIKLEPKKVSPLLKALNKEYIIFKYANDYFEKQSAIEDPLAFKFSDYAGFIAFADNLGFKYKTGSNTVLTTLEEKLIEDDIDEELKSSIDKLKAAINTAKADDFEQYKDEIIFEVEQELVSRYFNQKGRIQKQLQNDSEVSAAIELLNDRTRYDDILKSPM